MKVTIALKKKSNSGLLDKIIEKAIKIWTRSKYFHVEMIIKDKWISTNPEAGSVYIHDLQPLSDKYDYFDVEVDGRKVKTVMKFLKDQVGKPYDYWGIFFSIILTMDLEDHNKWFCSEIVSEALVLFGIKIPKSTNEMTPEDIYQLLKENNVTLN